MHPIFSSNRTLLSVSLLWTMLCILIAVLLSQLLEPNTGIGLITFQTLPWYFIFLFFGASNYYLCLRLPLAQTRLSLLFTAQCITAAITLSLWLALGFGWNTLLNQMGFNNAEAMFSNSLMTNGILGLVLYIVWILIHYTHLGAKGDETTNASALAHQLLIKNIELEAIKLTVHPHFMYNSLTMVANLSLSAPEKIHEICVNMSDFLRYSVTYGKQDTVSFDDELTHIKNYLAIEAERYGSRLSVTLTVDPDTLNKPTIALVLFPLIENAIKHGIGSQLEGGFIHVKLQQDVEQTLIHIENSFDPNGIKPHSTKLGLSSLEKRLKYSFGALTKIQINSNNDIFTVDIALPPLQNNSLRLLGA